MMNRIKELRNEKGMTQSELGDVLGVKQSAIKKYELSEVNIPQDKIMMLADYFCVTSDYLLGMSEYKSIEDAFAASFAPKDGWTEKGYTTEQATELKHELDGIIQKAATETLTNNEKRLISYFRGFNQEGQEKALDLLDDLAASGKYIKTGSLGMVVKEKQA